MPPAIEELERDLQADVVDSDQDAEGEEETDLYQMDAQLQNAVHRAYSGEVAEETGNRHAGNHELNEDVDAEGEPDSEANTGGGNEETEPVGAVKLPENAQSSDNEDAASETADADAEGEADPAFENNESSAASSSEESDADEDWEGESHGREDAKADIASQGNCM